MLNDRKTIGAFVYELNRQTGTATILPKKRVYRCQFKPGNYKGEMVVPAYVTYRRKTYTVTTIGAELFSGCKRLTSVVIPDTVTAIHHSAFQCCAGLRHIEIPDGVTHIWDCAFLRCQSLQSVRLSRALRIIAPFAFCNCDALTSITIPEHVEKIGDSVFRRCYALREMAVDKRNKVFDSRGDCNAIIVTRTNTLYLGCSGSVIPQGVRTIGKMAFYQCKTLTNIEIPDSVVRIKQGAFSWCENLTSVRLPKGLKYIEADAFWMCEKLASVVLPETLVSIGKCAFQGCSSITSVVIPRNVKRLHYTTFQWCEQMAELRVEPGNQRYDSRDECNAIIDTQTQTLVTGCMNSTIPTGVLHIGGWAFSGCKKMHAIKIT